MEASRHLPEPGPEEPDQRLSEQSRHLTLVPDAQEDAARPDTDTSVQIPDDFESFVAELPPESEWAGMDYDEIMRVRDGISRFLDLKARQIVQLQEVFDKAHNKLIFVNGYVRDRRQP